MASERLFTPVKLGHVDLKHRTVMAPLTRFRADEKHVPGPLAKKYYEQRAAVPGTFIITEATFISPRAGGYRLIPGIWSEEQVKGWKEITDAVHAKGSFIFLQLWALGRVADGKVLEEEGGFKVHSASAINYNPGGKTVTGEPTRTPKELTEDEIKTYLEDYKHAAKNAIKAGFDGVEIHGANGYLVDQFWQDVSNQRTDAYGGSIENRARFGLEVAKAVISAIGDSKKVGLRLSPHSDFQSMGMKDPIPQFLYITKELKKLDLAYLHLVESRLSGSSADGVYRDVTNENDPLIEAWGTTAPILLAGGFTPEKAKRVVSEQYPKENVLIAFGRYFISTPDLPYRIEHGITLNDYDRSTFYKPGEQGYADYPFSKEFLAQSSKI